MGVAVLVGLVALVVPRARAWAEADWKKLSDEDGVLVEGRPRAGTDLREIRVRTHTRLPPEALFAVIWDVARQHEFVPNVKVLRVLRASDEEAVIYERVKIPVIQDRDYVLKLTRRIDPHSRVHEVFAIGASELGPRPDKGVVRMTRLESHFVLRPAADGGTDLSYESFGDPVGKVPRWIIRAADVRGPREFVRAMIKRAEQLARR